MAETGNYQLKQWEKTDRIQMEDFNADNAKTDQALAELAAQAAQIAKCGNCKIVYGTYKGSGTYGSSNPNTLIFDHKPMLVAIMPSSSGGSMYGIGFLAVKGSPLVYTCMYYSQSSCTVTWTGNNIKWYNSANSKYQFNESSLTYYYVALLAADE